MITPDRFRRAILRSRSYNPAVLLRAMLLLLVLQLAWWVVFYELDNRKTEEIRVDLDRAYIAIAEKEPSRIRIPEYIVPSKDGYILEPEIILKRRLLHWRKIAMLASETFFVILVILLGARQILRSMEKEKRLTRERDMFVNSVTHELKTPLALLLLNLQTVRKRKLPPEKMNRLFDESIDTIRRLESQVNNILLSGELMRKSGQKLEGPVRTELGKAIESYLDENRSFFQMEKARVELRRNPEDSFLSRIHPDLFHKILSNLVQNAIQYCDTEPRILIELGIQGKFCILVIADNGPGIPEEERFHVFKPFYRLQNDRRIIRGTGMGLHLVKEIVTMTGGRVEIAREEGQKGSKFVVHLPRIVQ